MRAVLDKIENGTIYLKLLTENTPINAVDEVIITIPIEEVSSPTEFDTLLDDIEQIQNSLTQLTWEIVKIKMNKFAQSNKP